jgi:flagellar hook-associated protein 1 FlgK
MSLFSALQIASNSLLVSQLGLQVVGNNIANANTPGYLRQQLDLAPTAPQRVGGLTMGLGVEVTGITQQIDKFLEERLRGASSDVANGEAQESVYTQLESILGGLGDNDLSSSLTKFFNSIQDILNQPDSASVRNLAVLQGGTLAHDVQLLAQRVQGVRQDVNDQVTASASDINSLLSKIADLNVKIVQSEGGTAQHSDAVGLRDSRGVLLKQLAGIVDIKTQEQTSGDVTVFINGDYVVSQGEYRPVTIASKSDRGLNISEIRLAATDSPIKASSGKLSGLIEARDGILGGFLDRLNQFSGTLINEFNKAYSSGQGLTGFSQLTSDNAVSNTTAALDQAGLAFTPTNGGFQIKVLNTQTGLTTTTDIPVQLNGLDDDTTLESLASQLDAVDGISCSVDESHHLQISADSPNVTFGFAQDTSGALAALGLNTFFKGHDALDIGINSVLQADPGKFAASSGGIGQDTHNAESLATLLNTDLPGQGGKSLAVLYDQMTSDVAQGSSVAKSVAEGYRTFQSTLDGQAMAISGVSIDEEAVRMIGYQRTFQASAKYISTISDLLDMLSKL